MPGSQLVTFRMLSVWQPWADFLVADQAYRDSLRRIDPELAALLPKDVENRRYGSTWTGILLIHASLRYDREAMDRFRLDHTVFVRGAVVGTVKLTGVVDDSPSQWARSGSKHWLVKDPVRLDYPVHCRGFQGAPRTPPPPVLATVLTQLEHQRQKTGPLV